MRNFLHELRQLIAESLVDLAIAVAPDTPAGRRLVDGLRGVLGEHFVTGVWEAGD